MQKYKSKIYGVVGALIFMLLLFLLLWFIYLDKPYTPEEEGVEVMFGYDESGGGMVQDEPQAEPQQSVAPPTPASSPSDNDLLTQDTEESLVLQKQREEEAKKKKAEEAERIRKQKEEQARIEAEKEAERVRIAQEKAKQQAAIDAANKLGQLVGNSGSAQGSNGTEGTGGQKGNPAGYGTSGGHAWSLSGRNLTGKLSDPEKKGTQEGKVVVSIRVNAEGKVISATIGQGTTISEKETQQVAIEAAKKATFTEGTSDVIGTITYNFKNK